MSEPIPARRQHGPALPRLWQEPFHELEELWERMGHVLDPGWIIARGAWQPVVDMEETDSEYLFEVDLPGVNRDDLQVDVRDHELTISGERKERERTGVVRRQTRRSGQFLYHGTLPADVDASKVEAGLENGVLSVKVPKAEQAKPQHIEIK